MARSPPSSKFPTWPGAWKGRVRIGTDFDAPLPDELLRAFEGLTLVTHDPLIRACPGVMFLPA